MDHQQQGTKTDVSGRKALPRFFYLSIAWIGGLVLALCVLWVVIGNNAAQRQRENAANLSSDIVSSLQLKLRGNSQFIQLLAEQRANGALTSRSFESRVSRFLADHPEFINLTWVDSSFTIVTVSPLKGNRHIIGLHLGLSEPKRASLLAKETRKIVYTRPFEAIQSSSSFELWVPVYRGHTFLGLFAGVYSCAHLLATSLPPAGLNGYSISMSDSAGGTLASYPLKGVGRYDKPDAMLSLDPPGYGTHIRVLSAGGGGIDPKVLMLLVISAFLILGLVYELWILRKETVKRLETEMKLLEEQERLRGIIADRDAINDKVRQSEQRFKQLFENSLHAIFLTVPGGAILAANPAACKMLGRSEEEILRGGRDIVIDPTDFRLLELIEERNRSGRAVGGLRFLKADGTPFEVEISTNVFVDHTGSVRATIIAQDIEERKRFENELAESEEKYRTLIEVSSDAIFINHGLEITYLNHAAVKLFGAERPEEIIGKSPLDFFHPDYHEMIRKRIADMLEGKTVPLIEEKIVRLDGRTVDVEVAATSFAYRGRRAVQVVLRDITQRKKLEQQLVQSQKLEGLGTLAGGIAHDFNNLLSAMMGNAELLKEHLKADERSQSYLDRIIDAAARGGSIARQLLLFARQSEINLQKISVSHIIEEVKTMLHHFLPRTVTVTSDIEVDNGLINGDAGHIHQIILNLCLNAKDAIDENGSITIAERTVDARVVREKFSANVTGKFVAVSISDNGTGIDEAILPKIFDPFFTTKEKGKGTGLGLSIVDGLVRNHNGYIEVKSNAGRGTTFTVYFPAIAHVKEVPDPSSAKISLTGRKILIVDDEQDIRLALEEYLQGLGATVLTAADGVEALELYEHADGPIDLVVTDLGMPNMNGETLVRNLHKADPQARIVISSGYLDHATRSDLTKAGVRDVLTKPYKFSEIQKTLEKIFRL